MDAPKWRWENLYPKVPTKSHQTFNKATTRTDGGRKGLGLGGRRRDLRENWVPGVKRDTGPQDGKD